MQSSAAFWRPAQARRLAAGLLCPVIFTTCLPLGCKKTDARSQSEPTRSEPSAPQPAPKPEVTAAMREAGDPAVLAPELLKAMVESVPESARMGLSELELARDLGLRSWVIDYSGGPLSCWLDVEETGQSTSPSRLPGPKGVSWGVQAESGRIVFAFRPGASTGNSSARSQRIAKRLGLRETVGEYFALMDAIGSREYADDPRQPRWWAGWNDFAVKETSRTEKVPPGEEAALLVLEAVEKNPAGEKPRKVKLTLKGQASKAK